MISANKLKGIEAQPYAYGWRKDREAQGWKFIGYLMPPESHEDMRQWYRDYKKSHREWFNLKKGVN